MAAHNVRSDQLRVLVDVGQALVEPPEDVLATWQLCWGGWDAIFPVNNVSDLVSHQLELRRPRQRSSEMLRYTPDVIPSFDRNQATTKKWRYIDEMWLWGTLRDVPPLCCRRRDDPCTLAGLATIAERASAKARARKWQHVVSWTRREPGNGDTCLFVEPIVTCQTEDGVLFDSVAHPCLAVWPLLLMAWPNNFSLRFRISLKSCFFIPARMNTSIFVTRAV